MCTVLPRISYYLEFVCRLVAGMVRIECFVGESKTLFIHSFIHSENNPQGELFLEGAKRGSYSRDGELLFRVGYSEKKRNAEISRISGICRRAYKLKYKPDAISET